jgi:hypothetical protein
MVMSSPRNPNICAACEQLLEADCAELDALFASVGKSKRTVRPGENSPDESAADDEHHETYSGAI